MTAIEMRGHLHSLDKIESEIQILKKAIADYKDMECDGIKAQQITDMPRGGGGGSSVVEQLAINVPREIADAQFDIYNLRKIEIACKKVLNRMKPDQYEVMRLRYLDKEPGKRTRNWEEIGEMLHICERRCRKIDEDAVNEMFQKYINSFASK
jgi:DNA-directed RNA polymerase specialized sigma subunit